MHSKSPRGGEEPGRELTPCRPGCHCPSIDRGPSVGLVEVQHEQVSFRASLCQVLEFSHLLLETRSLQEHALRQPQLVSGATILIQVQELVARSQHVDGCGEVAQCAIGSDVRKPTDELVGIQVDRRPTSHSINVGGLRRYGIGPIEEQPVPLGISTRSSQCFAQSACILESDLLLRSRQGEQARLVHHPGADTLPGFGEVRLNVGGSKLPQQAGVERLGGSSQHHSCCGRKADIGSTMSVKVMKCSIFPDTGLRYRPCASSRYDNYWAESARSWP